MNPRAFDLYLRSITTSLLSLGLVGATVYEFVRAGRASPELITWTGLVVGVYIGAHVSLNGAASRKRDTDSPADEPSHAPPAE